MCTWCLDIGHSQSAWKHHLPIGNAPKIRDGLRLLGRSDLRTEPGAEHDDGQKNEISPNIHLREEDLAPDWNEMSLLLVEADRCCGSLGLLWFVRTILGMYAGLFMRIVVNCLGLCLQPTCVCEGRLETTSSM